MNPANGETRIFLRQRALPPACRAYGPEGERREVQRTASSERNLNDFYGFYDFNDLNGFNDLNHLTS
jgi:hypothetical protein